MIWVLIVLTGAVTSGVLLSRRGQPLYRVRLMLLTVAVTLTGSATGESVATKPKCYDPIPPESHIPLYNGQQREDKDAISFHARTPETLLRVKKAKKSKKKNDKYINLCYF